MTAPPAASKGAAPGGPGGMGPDARRANAIFKAFADETRLRILHLLLDGEMCVGDLVTVLGLPQPTVSRHLARLRSALLVEMRKNGLWRFYRLARADNPLQERLYTCLGSYFETIPRLKADRDRNLEMRRSGAGCCPGLARAEGIRPPAPDRTP